MLVDIAYEAGRRKFRPSDNSRDTAATLIAWGDEFSRQHEDTDRTEKEFLDEIYRFTAEKLQSVPNNIPIIMVSAKTQDIDKIVGLSTGADDYVAKPFNPLELMARVKSQLRRYRELNPSKPHERQEVISLKHLEINKVTHQVVCYGESIKLTPIEFDILYLLASNPGRVFGTDEIFERVWHEKFYEANNTVMVHIRRLRGKMKDDTREDKIITTVWGVGYKIEA